MESLIHLESSNTKIIVQIKLKIPYKLLVISGFGLLNV
jgi:hypothetical protein